MAYRTAVLWKMVIYICNNLGTSTMSRQVTGLKVSSTIELRTQLYKLFIISVVTKVTMQRARSRRSSLFLLRSLPRWQAAHALC